MQLLLVLSRRWRRLTQELLMMWSARYLLCHDLLWRGCAAVLKHDDGFGDLPQLIVEAVAHGLPQLSYL